MALEAELSTTNARVTNLRDALLIASDAGMKMSAALATVAADSEGIQGDLAGIGAKASGLVDPSTIKPPAPKLDLSIMPRNTLNGWEEVATLSFTDGPMDAAALKAKHGVKLFGYSGYEPTRKGVGGLYAPDQLFDVPQGANYLRARPRNVNGKYLSGAIMTNGWNGIQGAMRHEMAFRVPKPFGTFKAVNMFWATDVQLVPVMIKTNGGNWKLIEVDAPEFDLSGAMGAYDHNVTSTPESTYGQPGFKANQNVNPVYSSGPMRLVPTDWVVSAVEWTQSYVAWFVNGELMRLWTDRAGIPLPTTMARQVFVVEPKLSGTLDPADSGELHLAWSRLFRKV